MLAVASAMAMGLSVPEAPKTAALGQAAPAFTLDDQNGKPISLSDYKGKIVVLEWTNKDCPFVERHLKAKTSNKLAEKYKEKNVAWLQIDSTSTHNTATNLKTVTDNGLTFPILNDSQGKTGHAYGAKTTPHVFIVNKDGNIAYMGGMDNDEEGNKKDAVNYVDKALGELTADKAVTTAETKPYGCSVKYAK
jgi:peroxiredoxin